ncbi:NAD-dependent protein deacetylase [Lampropedia puyangensis]|uniref:protein acetyllysine N-acetyltransferase n=1 Tax=Lampropedia puyangensis TaxID=1330072 RepID=A0A4S8FAG3_9BURK|nr:NAD-dependent protein deacetylase [Lampropedia puyangensis]THU04578.1 NAD-dependent protein deacetylase [Lampropedia puyangensis]
MTNTNSAHIAALAQLHEWLHQGPAWMALTGAGMSTASGIPDYRDARGQWKRPAPIYFQPFMADAAVRARYWARSMVGWRFFSTVQPNAAHVAVCTLQRQGLLGLVVTQNVDGLHEKAGSSAVIDLHGRLDQVRCMQCGHRMARPAYQTMLEARNPQWLAAKAASAPDGDADLEGVNFSQFSVVPCPICGGIIKPDVVFYGEHVPVERHQQATAALQLAGGLVVLGTSLMVQSSYRYAVLAAQLGKPIVIINQGLTRADGLAKSLIPIPVERALAALVHD